jgi:hypothetical protein
LPLTCNGPAGHSTCGLRTAWITCRARPQRGNVCDGAASASHSQPLGADPSGGPGVVSLVLVVAIFYFLAKRIDPAQVWAAITGMTRLEFCSTPQIRILVAPSSSRNRSSWWGGCASAGTSLPGSSTNFSRSGWPGRWDNGLPLARWSA